MKNVDVAVIGGGMVGSAVALGLAKLDLHVALIEAQAPAAYLPEQPMDLRVSAISPQSISLLDELDAWPSVLAMRCCPYRRLETWEHPACRTRFNADELAVPQLGFIVENRLIQLALWQQFSRYPQLECITPARVNTLGEHDGGQLLVLDNGQRIQARLVVGADGANSMVRQQANIGVTAWDYRQHCMLINVATTAAQQDITWQQFSPTGPKAFLPLPGHRASLVWYDTPAKIRQLSRLSLTQLTGQIQQHFPAEVGEVEALAHASFPLTRRHAQRYFSNNSVLVGDAAHTINPLAGQGLNLGFKDVEVLLQEIGSGGSEPVEWQAILARYQQRRRPDNLLMQTAMDGFYGVFSNHSSPLRVIRNLALGVAEHSGPLKREVLRYALGL